MKFTLSVFEHLVDAARTMHHICQSHDTFALTYNEFLHLILEPDQAKSVIAANEVLRPDTHLVQNCLCEFPGFRPDRGTSVTFSNRQCRLLPRVGTIREGDPHAEALAAWCKRWEDYSSKYHSVHMTLAALENNCNTLAHARYAWPPVLHLVRQSEHLKPYADDLIQVKVPSSLPIFTQHERETLREAAGVLSTWALLPDPAEKAADLIYAKSVHI